MQENRKLKDSSLKATSTYKEGWQMEHRESNFTLGRPDSPYAVTPIGCQSCSATTFEVGVDMDFVVARCTSCGWQKKVG